jgi:hypothetical protein
VRLNECTVAGDLVVRLLLRLLRLRWHAASLWYALGGGSGCGCCSRCNRRRVSRLVLVVVVELLLLWRLMLLLLWLLLLRRWGLIVDKCCYLNEKQLND